MMRAARTGLAAVALILGMGRALGAQEPAPMVFQSGIGPLAAVTIYVRDHERALRWYTERLGFEVRVDLEYASGERVLAVSPPGQETPLIHLALTTTRENPEYSSLVGNQGGWIFQTSDLVETYMQLRDLNVRFTESPTETFDGMRAIFVDLYGNEWTLLEREKG